MSSSARIDELRRKFDENPRRFFAPLANEHRKAGDLEQAIALCRAHLPHQAGHISGHIVLAQALTDAGEHDEARYVFHQALELDPENLIALRYLGDLARERGDLADAGHWYQRVLEVDPRNEEMAQLARQVESERLAVRVPREPTPHASTAAVESGEVPAMTATPPAASPPPLAVTPEPIAELDEPLDATFESRFGPPLDAPAGPASELEKTDDASTGDLAPPAAWWATPTEPTVLGADRSGHADPASDEWQRIGGSRSLEPLDVSSGLDISGLGTSSASPLDADGASAGDSVRGVGDDPGAADLSWSDEPSARDERKDEATPAASGSDHRSLDLADLGDLEAAADPFLDDWLTSDHREAAVQADPFAPTVDDRAAALSQGADFEDLAESTPEPALDFEEIALEDAMHGAEHDDSAANGYAFAGEADPFMGRMPLDEPPVAEPTRAAFVTETMAELYMQQGFDDEALEVYRQLLAQRPDDATLRERVAVLEATRVPEHPIAAIEVTDDAAGPPSEATLETASSVISIDADEWADATAPVEAVEPLAPFETIESIEPVESSDAIESIESIESIGSIESIDAIEPVEAIDSIESIEPAEIVESFASRDIIAPVDLHAPVESLSTADVGAKELDAPVGPSAREFFAGLAARRPVDASDLAPSNGDGATDRVHAEHADTEPAAVGVASEGADRDEDEDIDAFNAWLEGLRKP